MGSIHVGLLLELREPHMPPFHDMFRNIYECLQTWKRVDTKSENNYDKI